MLDNTQGGALQGLDRTNGPVASPSDAPLGGDGIHQEGTSMREQSILYSLELVQRMRRELLEATQQGYSALRSVLPAELCCKIVEDAFQLIRSEPTLLEINLQDPVEVIVVGDTHGQFHDVCQMLDLIGPPNSGRTYIFNGDFVDRGAWGVELLVLLLLLKLASPTWVYLLRGNHESSTCTKFYGFKAEVDTKFSPSTGSGSGSAPDGAPAEAAAGEGAAPSVLMPPVLKPHADAKAVYKAFKKLFSVLPLAALVQRNTLILHGGLFRHPAQSRKVGSKRGRRPGQPYKLVLGSLDDLRAASKGGLDPDGCGASLVASDVLWSDPVGEAGLQMNDARGVGLTFGPDISQEFLEANSLSLIIRSHEGPDARDKRTDVPQVLSGFSLDHVTPAGNLVTVFSAPDYPQFQEGCTRYNNQGAVAVLTAPSYCSPEFRSFDASLPRPKARAFYDYLAYADTDEEPGGDEGAGSGMSESALSAGAASSQEPGGGGEAQEGDAVSSIQQMEEDTEGAAVKRAKEEVVGLGPSPGAALGEDVGLEGGAVPQGG